MGLVNKKSMGEQGVNELNTPMAMSHNFITKRNQKFNAPSYEMGVGGSKLALESSGDWWTDIDQI